MPVIIKDFQVIDEPQQQRSPAPPNRPPASSPGPSPQQLAQMLKFTQQRCKRIYAD